MFWLVGRAFEVVVGFLYPAYESYKAIKRHSEHQAYQSTTMGRLNTLFNQAAAITSSSGSSSSSSSSATGAGSGANGDENDPASHVDPLSSWLTYWIVIGAFTAVESVTDLFISWLPLYSLAKMLMIMWLILPQTQGHLYVYVRFLQPLIARHEKEIDAYLAKVKTQIGEQSAALGQQGISVIQNTATSVIQQAAALPQQTGVGAGGDDGMRQRRPHSPAQNAAQAESANVNAKGGSGVAQSFMGFASGILSTAVRSTAANISPRQLARAALGNAVNVDQAGAAAASGTRPVVTSLLQSLTGAFATSVSNTNAAVSANAAPGSNVAVDAQRTVLAERKQMLMRLMHELDEAERSLGGTADTAAASSSTASRSFASAPIASRSISTGPAADVPSASNALASEILAEDDDVVIVEKHPSSGGIPSSQHSSSTTTGEHVDAAGANADATSLPPPPPLSSRKWW